jgi:hypothetical protein
VVADLVDLDRADRDDRRGGHGRGGLRGDDAHARGDRAARAGPGRAGTRRGGRAAAGARGRAEVGEQQLLEQQQRGHRQDGRERLVRLAQRLAERDAAVAGPQVAADRGARAPQALGDLAELVAHLVAAEQARLGRLGERDARAHEQRLDRRDRGLHRLGDLLVGERVDLAQQEGRALRLGQPLHVLHELAELLASVHLVRRRRPVLGEVDVHRVHADRLGAAEVVQRAVARDAVQPRPHVQRSFVADHRVERGGEDLLQDVLGVLARAQHVAAEREQARLVARHEGLVGRLVPASRQRDETLVGLDPQERRRATDVAVDAGVGEGRRFHRGTVGRSSRRDEHGRAHRSCE